MNYLISKLVARRLELHLFPRMPVNIHFPRKLPYMREWTGRADWALFSGEILMSLHAVNAD